MRVVQDEPLSAGAQAGEPGPGDEAAMAAIASPAAPGPAVTRPAATGSAATGPAATRPAALVDTAASQAAGRSAGAGDLMAGDPIVSEWRAIATCYAAASAALEHELGARHGLGVSEFEVLDRLAENLPRHLRAQELAEAVHLSQSALSRLIDRLQKHGLVERCLCDNDRRGIFVVLTESGQRRHAEAARTHRQVLASVLPAARPTG